mmetsp:Transcript_20965/g.23799  ORF Transcript_20965/g.23799 Transcript_20965/m.23799 type:complete len:488 (-) Transcript_20965:76-1539(-)
MKRTNLHYGHRVTQISHHRKGQQHKKTKPNPCMLMSGVITTILMTFIYLVTSSMHRTLLEESAEYDRQQRVQISLKQKQEDAIAASAAKPTDHKFVTVVLPSVVNTNGRSKRLDSISKTWGPAANAIFVTHDEEEYMQTYTYTAAAAVAGAQNSSDFTSNDIDNNNNENDAPKKSDKASAVSEIAKTNKHIYPQAMFIPPSVATEDQGVPRLQYVMENIVKTYNPDYAFFVNDHTFVIPQHLCKFLNSNEEGNDNLPNEHFYAGHPLKPQGATPYAFNSGASGYFLSRYTMKTLVDKFHANGGEDAEEELDENCQGTRKWLQGNPGLLTANCLKMSLGVDPIDTRDEWGRHTFHAYGIVRTVKGDFDDWYIRKHDQLNVILGEDEKYHHELKKGKECCSPNTISFHYVEFAETVALHVTLQKILEVGGPSNISDEELKEFIETHWPTDKKDIGGYSHNLPPQSKKTVWDDILYVVKNIAPSTPLSQC